VKTTTLLETQKQAKEGEKGLMHGKILTLYGCVSALPFSFIFSNT